MAASKSKVRKPYRRIESAEKNKGADFILAHLVKGSERETKKTAPAKVAIPKPPEEILDATGMREWRRICQIMIDDGTLSDLDLTTLVLYCDAWADFVRACRELKKKDSGIVQTGKTNGGKFRNPWYDIKKKAMQEMTTYSVVLGFSARDRKNKGMAADAPANPFDKI